MLQKSPTSRFQVTVPPKFVLSLSCTITRLFISHFMGLFLLSLTLFYILPQTARIRFK